MALLFEPSKEVILTRQARKFYSMMLIAAASSTGTLIRWYTSPSLIGGWLLAQCLKTFPDIPRNLPIRVLLVCTGERYLGSHHHTNILEGLLGDAIAVVHNEVFRGSQMEQQAVYQ